MLHAGNGVRTTRPGTVPTVGIAPTFVDPVPCRFVGDSGPFASFGHRESPADELRQPV